jgi:SnoaL-like domain
MTLDERLAREAIRDTLARYNMAGDRLRLDDFVAVFTKDAVLESDVFRCEGRAGIRDWFGGFGRTPETRPDPARPAPTVVRHQLATCRIELTGADTAEARTYWTVFSDIGPDHGGVYSDRFRREGERWLIAHRRIRVDWKAPGTLFGGPAAGPGGG